MDEYNLSDTKRRKHKLSCCCHATLICVRSYPRTVIRSSAFSVMRLCLVCVSIMLRTAGFLYIPAFAIKT